METKFKTLFLVARKSDGFFIWFGPFDQSAWSDVPDIKNAHATRDDAERERLALERDPALRGQLYTKPLVLAWEAGGDI